jgi:SAM-dependent methyltransferase
MGYSVVGIDFSEPMIEQARKNVEALPAPVDCRFQCVDFAEDTNMLGSYDGLIALGFIEYFDDPVAVLRRMQSVLADQGIAVVQIWNSRPLADRVLAPVYRCWQFLTHPLDSLRGAVRSLKGGGGARGGASGQSAADSPPAVVHRRYTPAELTGFAAEAGFGVVDARGSLFFPTEFFGGDDLRSRWDERLQELAANSELWRRQAVNYIAVLRKRDVPQARPR